MIVGAGVHDIETDVEGLRVAVRETLGVAESDDEVVCDGDGVSACDAVWLSVLAPEPVEDAVRVADGVAAVEAVPEELGDCVCEAVDAPEPVDVPEGVTDPLPVATCEGDCDCEGVPTCEADRVCVPEGVRPCEGDCVCDGVLGREAVCEAVASWLGVAAPEAVGEREGLCDPDGVGTGDAEPD